MYNSTIKAKTGICPLCSDGKEKPLTKGLCVLHYWMQIKTKSAAKQQEKEVIKEESLSTLINDLDVVFSRYIRIKNSDLYGNVKCISCNSEGHWRDFDCGHFIPRGNMYTRFLEQNCAPQCIKCNRVKNGNLAVYAKAIELINPGCVELLMEQGRIVYNYSRDELKSMIADYTKKVKKLLP